MSVSDNLISEGAEEDDIVIAYNKCLIIVDFLQPQSQEGFVERNMCQFIQPVNE